MSRVLAAAAALALMGAALPALADDITVSVTRVRAVDKSDQLSKPDFLTRITIAGESFVSKPVLNQTDIKPDWAFTKSVARGKHPIKIEILDKDITKNDPADINRVANKRDLDFEIDTASCRVLGLTGGYRCGSSIVRAGQEKKSAEITFKVSVKKTNKK